MFDRILVPTSLRALLLGVAVTLGFGAVAAPLADPLDTPVAPSAFAAKGATAGIARSGERMLAVGPRGLILRSVDAGKSWRQVPSPVATDLVSVKFTDSNTAWAVGHDAVALRSLDGGGTWQRMLDGRLLLKLLRAAYAARAGEPGSAEAVKEIERSAMQSARPDVLPTPFLDVWFADENEGFLVGGFGLLLRTRDGGKSWEPWMERSENERHLHLYAMAGRGEHRFIAGEQGLLLRWDVGAQRFTKVQTPYAGTFFGVDATAQRIVAYGLRGNAYLSSDGGARWEKIDTGVDASLVALVPLADTRFLLVSQDGQVLVVAPGNLKAVPQQVPFTTEVFGAAIVGSGGLALAQLNGVRVVELVGQMLR